MQPVAVRILHPADDAARPLGRLGQSLLDARARNAERLCRLVRQAKVGSRALDVDVEVVTGPRDEPFAQRLRDLSSGLAREHPDGSGLVLLGSGAIPLATVDDVRALLDAASSDPHGALANNRYSADVIALGSIDALARLPDLPGDNAVPRWLQEVAGFEVRDLRDRWWLAMDLDSPLDPLLAGIGDPDAAGPIDAAHVVDVLRRVRAVVADRRAELLVAGRTGAATLGWLERSTASRVRALVEERGLRASTERALAADGSGQRGPGGMRPPRSILGLALDDRGPAALGAVLAELADAAVVDSRVLLAHRLGADESRWPGAEDRFASDLLLPDPIEDPWLRELTVSAREASIPVLLGGHSLVGPGIRLALGDRP